MKSHDCKNGFIYVKSDDGRTAMRRCLVCAEERFTRAIGRDGTSWETWQHVEELATQVNVLKNWQGGQWSVCLHAADGKSNFGSGKTDDQPRASNRSKNFLSRSSFV